MLRRVLACVPLVLVVAGAAASAPQTRCPNGTGFAELAFVEEGRLLVYDMPGCNGRVLVRRGVRGSVRWSADGRYVLFSGGVASVDSGRIFRALQGVWSPRGHRLASVTRRGGVVVSGPDMGARRVVPDGWGVGSVTWAPSGEFLVLARSSFSQPTRNGIWLYHLRTGNRQLVAGVFPLEDVPVLATISPGADWVFWWRFYDHAASANADGVPLLGKRIAGGAGLSRLARYILAAPEFLSWCGGRLVLAAGRDRYTTRGKRLLVAGPPAWQPRDLSRDTRRSWTSPSCSPDGRRVAVSAGRNWIEPRFGLERRSIWLLSLDGRSRRRLTAPPPGRSDELPRWNEDGSAVFFIRSGPTRGDTSARGTLYVVRLGGQPPEQVAELGVTGNYYGRYGWAEQTDLHVPRIR